jgi:hypothetical protein
MVCSSKPANSAPNHLQPVADALEAALLLTRITVPGWFDPDYPSYRLDLASPLAEAAPAEVNGVASHPKLLNEAIA